MQFITCRGCKLPFERKVPTCPNCGELLPRLSKFKLEAVHIATVEMWALGLGVGCFFSAEVITRPPGLPEPLQWAALLGVPLFVFGLSQLLASSVAHRDEADRRFIRRFFGIEGALIGILLCGMMTPGLNEARDLVIASWGLFTATAVGLPSTCWWLRLKRRARTCWMATRHLASEGYSETGDKLKELELTCAQVSNELPPALLAERLAILDRARENFQALRARYRACEWQTDLLRWHARLKFHLEGPAPVNRAGCQEAIAALDKHGARGVALLREWQATQESTYPDPKDCIGRLEQLLELCGRLRQNMLDHQIMLVTRDPRAGATPEDTTFHQLRADLRALET